MPVADTNVFIHGRKRPFSSALTVPEVLEELKSSEARLSFDLSDIEVAEPSDDAVDTVKAKSNEIDSPTSDVDEKLLALALEKGEELFTDDKALQNLALHLGIEFNSFLSDGVEEKVKWRTVCENCGEEVEGDRCPRCGSTLLRRKRDRCS